MCTLTYFFIIYFLGTSHDWRLRCGAVDLYFTLFGLSRPSCLPLPELGLVLNLKEKKAVLNPTIIPEAITGNQETAINPSSHAQLVGFQNPVRRCSFIIQSYLEKIITSFKLADFKATKFLVPFKNCWLTLFQSSRIYKVLLTKTQCRQAIYSFCDDIMIFCA